MHSTVDFSNRNRLLVRNISDLAVCICFVTCVFGNSLWILAVGLVLLLVVIRYGRDLTLKISGLHIYILCFTAFVFLSCLWAKNPNLTIPKGTALISAFIIILIVSMNYNEDNSTERLLKVLMYGGYLVVLLYIVIYGWSGILKLLAESERPDNELLNANVLGMTAAFSIIINIYQIFIVNKKLILTDLLIIPVSLMVFISESRKALLIILIGIVGIFIFANAGKKRKDIVWVRVLVIAVAAIAAVVIVLHSTAFSTLLDRTGDVFEAIAGEGTRGSNSAWLRFRYMELGMSLFLKSPFVGIGIGNANLYTMAEYGRDHYLHNNYSELLACGGLIGFVLYYSIYIYILIVFIKYKKYRTEEYNMVFLLFIIFLIMGIGAVQYYSKYTYFFMLLFWLEAEKLKKNAKEAAYENISICSKAAA